MSLQRYEIKTVVSGSPNGELVLLSDVIKLLDTYPLPQWSPTEYHEYTEGYITGFQDALALIQGEELVGIDPKIIALIKGEQK